MTLSNLKDVQVNGNLGIIRCAWKEKKQLEEYKWKEMVCRKTLGLFYQRT